jgi:hypothetical protein
MARLKMVLWALLVLLVTLGAGWIWGASGRWAAERQARDADLRLQLADARAALASARVDVFELNFGQASREIERAKAALSGARATLDRDGPAEAAVALGQAQSKAGEAQQLAGNVDPAANSRVAEAIKALERAAELSRK